MTRFSRYDQGLLSETDLRVGLGEVSRVDLALYGLAERVAALNPDAGEIGAGMLAQLVDEARRVVALADRL